PSWSGRPTTGSCSAPGTTKSASPRPKPSRPPAPPPESLSDLSPFANTRSGARRSACLLYRDRFLKPCNDGKRVSMELFLLAAQQMLVMMLYLFLGFILVRLGLLSPEGSRDIASILVKLVIPAVIIESFCV